MIKNKNAVILSSWISNPERIPAYIGVLIQYYKNYDIFVGYNPSEYSSIWVDELLKTGLNIKIKETPSHLVIPQHASAVQTALQLYLESDMDYELVHFIHTKGMSYVDYHYKRAFKDYYLSYSQKLKDIEKFFQDNKDYGGWSEYGQVQYQWYQAKQYNPNSPKGNEWFSQSLEDSTDIVNEQWDWSKYYDFKYKPLRTQFLTAFYTIRNNIVKEFFTKCNPDLLNKNTYELGMNIFWVETEIAQIVCRMGYLRYIDKLWRLECGNKDIEEEMKKLYIKENNIIFVK